ncbi:unnamed protein product [Trifolium pratense]|uniref:Uncharacterized protein n=1 Tax=Trifolium pratense TaxID=57577 RepID=A0ACB0KHR3_TRIPR|nr:unnamed protein product [Trifolium pratense]
MMMTGNLHNAKTFVVALTIWALQRICLDHALQDSVQGWHPWNKGKTVLLIRWLVPSKLKT